MSGLDPIPEENLAWDYYYKLYYDDGDEFVPPENQNYIYTTPMAEGGRYDQQLRMRTLLLTLRLTMTMMMTTQLHHQVHQAPHQPHISQVPHIILVKIMK